MPFDTARAADLPVESVLALYLANEWSSAQKPDLLHKGLLVSHSLITAWAGSKLVGLGNAISDGYLVVYYPHNARASRVSGPRHRHRAYEAAHGAVSSISSARGCRRRTCS